MKQIQDPPPKIKSPVKMDGTKQRVMMFDEIQGPNENRFELINTMPSVLSKYA